MIQKISVKFLLGFFLIFLISFLVLNQTVKEFIHTSNQRLVTSELTGLKNNSHVYVRQAFMINHFTSNELYFGEMAQGMAIDLQNATGSTVGVYTVDGELLYASEMTVFKEDQNSDLQQAINGHTAYSIIYGQHDDRTSVLFSYPVVIDGAKVGILRYAKDFSLLYQQTGRILDIILYLTLAVFTAAFSFTFLFSRHITVPLIKLARTSSEVKNGNLDVRVHLNRKDEIGRLAENFNDMIDQISLQMGTIQQDRDRLKELNQQEKRFYDNMTHELKTPLTSILGYAELIKEHGEQDRNLFDKGMNHIAEESRRLHNLVVRLLETSRANALVEELETVDSGLILADVCDAMQIKAKRYKKTIVCEIDKHLMITARSEQMRQVFINLLDNAIKYSLSHSDITVKAERALETVRIVIVNAWDHIDESEPVHWFHPFYSAHPDETEAGSAGLGLGIVKSIVDSFGGDITITTPPNQMVVTLTFEAYHQRARGGKDED